MAQRFTLSLSFTVQGRPFMLSSTSRVPVRFTSSARSWLRLTWSFWPCQWMKKSRPRQLSGREGFMRSLPSSILTPPKPKTTDCQTPAREAAWMPASLVFMLGPTSMAAAFWKSS